MPLRYFRLFSFEDLLTQEEESQHVRRALGLNCRSSVLRLSNGSLLFISLLFSQHIHYKTTVLRHFSNRRSLVNCETSGPQRGHRPHPRKISRINFQGYYTCNLYPRVYIGSDQNHLFRPFVVLPHFCLSIPAKERLSRSPMIA